MRLLSASRLRHLLSWLLVVVVTATVTTIAVAHVGDDVAGELTTAPPVLDAATSGTPAPPAATHGTVDRPSPTPSEPETARPSATPSLPETPSARSRATVTEGDHHDGSGGSAEADASSRTDGPSRTFSTPGGVVVAVCRGDRPSAKSVTPRYGYAFRTESDGKELTVKFTGSDREYALHIRCRSGTPVLVESDDSRDG